MAFGLFNRFLNREEAPPRAEGVSRFVAASATEASRKHVDKETGTTIDAVRRREGNEDASMADVERGLIGLADGVGGGGRGDEASGMAMEALEDASREIDRMVGAAKRDRLAFRELGTRVSDILDVATREVASRVRMVVEQYKKEGKTERPQCTFIVAKAYERGEGQYEAAVARVGNSRAYVWRADGRVERVHFPVAEGAGRPPRHELIDAFLQSKELDQREVELLDQATSVDQLIERWNAYLAQTGKKRDEESMRLKYRNVYKNISSASGLQVMGMAAPKDLHVQTAVIKDLRPGDRVVLVSDGISDGVPEMDMREILQGATSAEEGARRLKDEAVRAMRSGDSDRAKDDDATVQILEIAGGQNRKTSTSFPRRGHAGEALTRSLEQISALAAENNDLIGKTYRDQIALVKLIKLRHEGRPLDEEQYRALYKQYVLPLRSEEAFLKEIAPVVRRGEQLEHEIQLAKAQSEALRAKRIVQEIEQVVRHEGMTPYWEKRLAARRKEEESAEAAWRELHTLAKATRRAEQAALDAEAIKSVRTDIERLTANQQS